MTVRTKREPICANFVKIENQSETAAADRQKKLLPQELSGCISLFLLCRWTMTGDTTKIFNAIDTVEEPEVKALRERLIERVRNAVKGDTPVDQIPGLHLSYVEQAQTVSNCFYVLSVGLILQGTKNLVIGDKSYRYGTGSMIVTSVDMPTSYELVGVKPSNPFVSLSLRLNPATIADFLLEEDPPQDGVRDVFNVEKPTQELLEDFERLLKLLDHPEQIKARAPILIRDIHYLALSSSSGACLRALYAPSTVGQRIRKSIQWLRANFREPVSVEQMASVAGMAPTTFHRHFKSFTSLSPLQYQKRLRLYEAQQFMLKGEGDVNSAAYAVGYQSPQQFNRDYKHLFGISPGKSIREQRQSLYEALSEKPTAPMTDEG